MQRNNSNPQVHRGRYSFRNAFLPPQPCGRQMLSHLPMRNLRAFLRTNTHHLILELGRLCIPWQPHIPEEKPEIEKSSGSCLRPHGQCLVMALGHWVPFWSLVLVQKLNHYTVLPLCSAVGAEKHKANKTGLLRARNLQMVSFTFLFSSLHNFQQLKWWWVQTLKRRFTLSGIVQGGYFIGNLEKN